MTSSSLSPSKEAKDEPTFLIPWSTLAAGPQKNACCSQGYTPSLTFTASAARTRSAGNMNTRSRTAKSTRKANTSSNWPT